MLKREFGIVLVAVAVVVMTTASGCSYRQLDDGSTVREFDVEKFVMAMESLDLALDKYFEIRERLDAEDEEEALEEAREEDEEFDRLISGAERVLGNETVQELIQQRIERKKNVSPRNGRDMELKNGEADEESRTE